MADSCSTPKLAGRLEGHTLELVGYRNQAPGFDPRSGEGARRFGGRFTPPNSFPVIYLCTTRIRSRSATGVDDVIAVMPENLSGAVRTAELIEEWAVPTDLDVR